MDAFTDKDRFLAASRSSQTLERRRMVARPLEAALSVWVENLSPTVDEGAAANKHETLSVYLIFVLWFCWEHVF